MSYLPLAEVSAEWSPFVQAGIPGIVLAWFMIRNEKNINTMKESLDVMSKSILLLVITQSAHPDSVTKQAQTLIDSMQRK